MNKKGSVFDVILWIIVVFAVVFVFAGLLYGYNVIGNELHSIPTQNGVNISEASDMVFTPVNNALNSQLKILAMVIIFGMVLSIFISNFLVKANPVFFIAYVIVTIGAIVVSAYLSNIYFEKFINNEVLGATFQSFTPTNYVIQYLPYWVAVIGILGAVFLFIGILRDRDEGGIV